MRRRAAGRQSGFVLVSVLLLGTLILVGVTGLSRHALLTEGHSLASLRIHEAREGNASSVAYTRQHLASGNLPDSTTLMTGGSAAVDLTLTELGGGRWSLLAESLHGDLGDTLRAEFATVAAPGGALPEFDGALASQLTADPASHWLSDGTVLSDQVLSGTYILRAGASVTLRDVVLTGTVLSEPALDGPPYAVADATTLRIEGGLRVHPLVGALEDVAVFLPDGALVGTADSRIELRGAVVADSLNLLGSAYLHHRLAATTVGVLAAGVEQPGGGRTPRAWPSALIPASRSVAWMAITPADATSAQLADIEGFTFP